VVSNDGGSVTSNSATLTVTTPPMITTQAADISVKVGKTAKFTVVASGAPPLQYQWRKERCGHSRRDQSVMHHAPHHHERIVSWAVEGMKANRGLLWF
jgi:hypothetical protein